MAFLIRSSWAAFSWLLFELHGFLDPFLLGSFLLAADLLRAFLQVLFGPLAVVSLGGHGPSLLQVDALALLRAHLIVELAVWHGPLDLHGVFLSLDAIKTLVVEDGVGHAIVLDKFVTLLHVNFEETERVENFGVQKCHKFVTLLHVNFEETERVENF